MSRSWSTRCSKRSSRRWRAGDRVELRGFGAFSVKKRDAGRGATRAPANSVEVEEKHVPFFKTGKLLRDASERKVKGTNADDSEYLILALIALCLIIIGFANRNPVMLTLLPDDLGHSPSSTTRSNCRFTWWRSAGCCSDSFWASCWSGCVRRSTGPRPPSSGASGPILAQGSREAEKGNRKSRRRRSGADRIDLDMARVSGYMSGSRSAV